MLNGHVAEVKYLFKVQGYLYLSVSLHDQNPIMTLNTKRSKVPHTHVYSYPQFPNFTPLYSMDTYFELQGIWRQVHQMTPK